MEQYKNTSIAKEVSTISGAILALLGGCVAIIAVIAMMAAIIAVGVYTHLVN